jgi:predicted O-linked N-acetylglucosamine transferase (SPINDLY family)
VKNSILWLVQGSELFQKNIQFEAAKARLDENRIYFASQVNRKEYLERYQIADLFLDTTPYNAGTTASDALWSGLPVLTQVGNSYPGRMAASLLKTLDLEELTAHSLDEYKDIAIDLATHPKRLAGIKRKLLEKRQNSRLFNSQIFCENLESAYIKMHLMYTSDDKFEDIEVLSSN